MVTMTMVTAPTMAMIAPATAEMTVFMAEPIAENRDPIMDDELIAENMILVWIYGDLGVFSTSSTRCFIPLVVVLYLFVANFWGTTDGASK
ncbi:hypothetical protein BS17DRAFT_786056 [Gyrodon lividus]|nr:hypothetical protein BS17DRAFT_786056 [Gyrodon lividus]